MLPSPAGLMGREAEDAVRHAVRFMLAASLAMATAGIAHAETPRQLLTFLLRDPGAALFGKHHAPRHPAPTAPETPLVDVPMPRLRPATADAVSTLAYQAEPPPMIAAPVEAIPLPRVSPADVAPAEAPAPPPAPELRLASLPPEAAPLPDLTRPPPAAQSTCGMALADLGVVAKPLDPIEDGQCGIPDPVSLASLGGGKVALTAKPVVDCAVAEALASWMDGTVQPMAASMLRGKVTGLRVLDAYSCRNRDGLADTKLSEHAHGNAIDIGAFQIDGGRWLTVGDAGTTDTDAAFLAAVRKSACGPFTTVLGPGSDSYHATHFHLDLAKRHTAGPSRGLFCE